MLRDSFGRVATDLRVSLTDKCNLRCSYCMPPEGLEWLPKRAAPHRRRDRPAGDDRRRTARHPEVRYTGGEPLLRRELVDIVGRTTALRPRPQVSLTTNGIGLARARRPARRGRTGPGQRLPRHPRPRHLQAARAPRPARRRARRAGRRPRRRACAPSRSTRCSCARSTSTRPCRCCATAWSRATSCGSSSRCRSTPSTAGAATTWSPPTRSSQLLSASFDLTADDPEERGSAPAERFLVDGGPRQGGRDRLGHPAVLRRLRPRTAHRRRADPQLPVRHRGVRPARPRCARAPSDDELAERWIAAVTAQEGRARHRRPAASCSRPARCRPSAASSRGRAPARLP